MRGSGVTSAVPLLQRLLGLQHGSPDQPTGVVRTDEGVQRRDETGIDAHAGGGRHQAVVIAGQISVVAGAPEQVGQDRRRRPQRVGGDDVRS